MKKFTPKTIKGPAEWFTGDVYPTFIFIGEPPSRVRMSSVHFTPGAHTAWHKHPAGQYLHIVEGTALVQERGGKVQKLTAGQTIYTAPGVEHWHGATPEDFMVHYSILEAPDNGEPESIWGDHLTDEEYKASK